MARAMWADGCDPLADDGIMGGMDAHQILAELREERERINEAILALERIAGSQQGKRRGRPPKWLQETRGGAGRKKKSSPKPN